MRGINGKISDAIELVDEEHFKSIFHNAVLKSSIVSRTDRYGRITYVNSNFEKICGYTKEELIGKPHSIISSKTHPPEFWKEVWKTISSGNSWRGVVCNRAKNGSLYWVDTFIYPYIDELGNLKEYFSIRNDITQRKLQTFKIKRSEAYLQSIFKSSRDQYVLLSPELNVLLSNIDGKIFIVEDNEEHQSMQDNIVEQLMAQAGFNESFNSALQGLATEKEIEVLKADGKVGWYYVRYLPAYDSDGKIIGVSVNSTNITARKQQEQRILAQNEVLSDIAWSGSHELRRPVASILGLLQLMEMPARGGITVDEFMNHLKPMVEELDFIIRKNVNRAYSAEVEKF